MGFFARFFIPELEQARADLAIANRWRQWYEDRAIEAGEANLKLKSDLKAEINRNRKREDLLMNQIVALGGGKAIPGRLVEEKAQKDDVPLPELTEQQLDLLYERARERCEQKYRGSEITTDMIDHEFAAMKTNAPYWLSD